MRGFVRHYVEIVIAMFAGMIVLGLPAEAGLRLIGSSSSDLQVDAPAVLLLGMALTMTVPMVAFDVSTSGATPVTVADSLRAPSSSVNTTRAVCWT